MTKLKYFGTDGIRGQVGEFPIHVEFLLKLGWAVGNLINQNGQGAKVLIGKDTRISGYMIESSLEAGLSAAGVDIKRLGSIPTPAIAYLTRTFRAQIGIVISASHNPYSDNGIKFFNENGYKLSDEEEGTIEKLIHQPIKMVDSQHLGKAYIIEDAQGRYIEYCKSSIPHNTNLRGLKIVLDCGNGATYHIAPFVLSELGADVTILNNKPNGFNINEHSGACHPEELQKAVLKQKAHIGIALDGDGDRVIMVDHKGEIVDGDEILYIILKGLLNNKMFSGGVVGTQMSNMGLELAIKNLGINFIRTDVGDQNIIQALLEKNWSLGGESSGHIVYFAVSTTGDGIISALQVLQTMFFSGKSLHQIKQEIKKFPQKMINVPFQGRPLSLNNRAILKEVKLIEDKLKPNGRVLLRYSGTEPVLRVMVEGERKSVVNTLALELSDHMAKLFRKNRHRK